MIWWQAMMQKAKYADYPSHKKIHDEFVAKISALSSPIDDSSKHFAKDWYVL